MLYSVERNDRQRRLGMDLSGDATPHDQLSACGCRNVAREVGAGAVNGDFPSLSRTSIRSFLRHDKDTGFGFVLRVPHRQLELVVSCQTEPDHSIRVDSEIVALHIVVTRLPVKPVVRVALCITAFEEEWPRARLASSKSLQIFLRALECTT